MKENTPAAEVRKIKNTAGLVSITESILLYLISILFLHRWSELFWVSYFVNTAHYHLFTGNLKQKDDKSSNRSCFSVYAVFFSVLSLLNIAS